jgi:non-ribosomal peptide synthetase component F
MDNQKGYYTIHQLVEDQVLITPDSVAIAYKDVVLTYRVLNERANRLAHYLIAEYDIRPQELVMLSIERSEHMLVAILAVLKAGGAYIPTNLGYSNERLENLFRSTKTRVLLCSGIYADHLNCVNFTATAVERIDSEAFEAMLSFLPAVNPARKVGPTTYLAH